MVSSNTLIFYFSSINTAPFSSLQASSIEAQGFFRNSFCKAFSLFMKFCRLLIMITTAASSGCRNHTTKDFRERFSNIFDTTLAVGLAVKEMLGLGRQGLEQLYISCRPHAVRL